MADPNFAEPPNFDDPDHESIRDALRIALGYNPEQILEHLNTTWRASNARRIDAWNVCKAAEMCEARQVEQQRQQQLEEEEQAAAKEAVHAQLEAESKRPKMNIFPPGTSALDILSLPPSQYALHKLTNFEFVELWYFLLPGRTDAAKYSNKSQADDTFGISKVDEHLTVRSIASMKFSKNALADHDLTFGDFLQAKNTFLEFAKKAKWPAENLDTLAKFFWYLETHPLLQVPMGQKIILTYASRVRADWHRELKAERGYDLSIINATLLSSISDEIRAFDNQQTRSQASSLCSLNT